MLIVGGTIINTTLSNFTPAKLAWNLPVLLPLKSNIMANSEGKSENLVTYPVVEPSDEK